ncbi:MAG TPA: hypothetical protein VGF92_01345 [Stellaceae bacterium]|jgi:uncharacterized protein YecT (DUF1311 family)
MKAWFATIFMSLLVFVGAPLAEAETFDCQKPTSPLARLICGDPVLRAADVEENELYDTALSASLDRASLRAEESAWFAAEILPYNWFAQHDAAINNGEIVDTYRKREDTLRRITQLWRKLRHNVPGATLAASCLALPIYPGNGSCSVAAFAAIEGVPSLHYQLQAYLQPAMQNAVVIFAATQDQPDAWLPIAVTTSKDASLSAPQATASPFGTLLTIASNGTGESDGSALYRLTTDALEDIDDRSWLETLRSRLPDGLALSPDIVADYGKMQAVGTVTRSQSSCCTVGSRAIIDLTIEDDHVAVKGVTFGEPGGSPNDQAN